MLNAAIIWILTEREQTTGDQVSASAPYQVCPVAKQHFPMTIEAISVRLSRL